ncbi:MULTISPECIES: hypothetical protein [Thermomonospora]|uniref:4'-phosphopantetheinyl transferase n=1 Tax=Thermomonospora curvata (strain ATCC 19995 / DSM 43183 / JCM 3096 / KCTC 9072 / NBRC 15933 / NCIMB 10081 / Henssen B9) TaxID=471852 RepID=D1AEK4_THECD|nr:MULTISPECIES: hypothetical protein [Thermomonospora]ACY95820.1 hypothetical protein Tcur_0215 [Thermomonospora curvata DSM 43183]PKK16073.1 MAG: hypothetical protein BUE48_001075 [Thermomonospora sp. CIF 1]
MPHGSIQLEVVSLGAQLRAEADDLLSAAELAYCLGFLRAEEHMGARVAAKRAVSRLLGGDLRHCRHQIELIREDTGPVRVRLHGELLERAQRAGLGVPRVSLTHAAGRAAAIAWLGSR